MWELIKQNKRRSIALFTVMGIVLMLLGAALGWYFWGDSGVFSGVSLAAIIWIVMSLIGYFSGDSIMLAASGAKKVTPSVHPQLFNVVEEMKIAAGLNVMPDIYIIPEQAPNAFATGKSPEKSAIAVTAGLLNRLNRDELQGVVAHEMGHIINRDTLYMTFSGVLLGSIIFLSRGFLRGMWFSGGNRNRSRSSQGGGQLQLVLMLASLAFAILAPLFAQLLYFSISRKREYLADATAVRLTRYPEGLASALEKISVNPVPLKSANKATAALYIVNPLLKNGSLMNLTSTHPPIKERISILRRISGGANYIHYQKAYNSMGKNYFDNELIPTSGINDSKNIALRQASPETAGKQSINNQKDINDLIRAVDNYYFINCTCGLKIKLPPGYNQPTVNCPRCNKLWPIPAVVRNLKNHVAKGEDTKHKDISKPLIYQRKTDGWESFSCSCGDVKQISPLFKGDKFICSNCGRTIIIKKQGAS